MEKASTKGQQGTPNEHAPRVTLRRLSETSGGGQDGRTFREFEDGKDGCSLKRNSNSRQSCAWSHLGSIWQHETASRIGGVGSPGKSPSFAEEKKRRAQEKGKQGKEGKTVLMASWELQ